MLGKSITADSEGSLRASLSGLVRNAPRVVSSLCYDNIAGADSSSYGTLRCEDHTNKFCLIFSTTFALCIPSTIGLVRILLQWKMQKLVEQVSFR